MAYKIEYSDEIDKRFLTILVWGNRGTRKTELGIRHFPDVLVIDVEGNSDAIVPRIQKIPEFARVKTKSHEDVVEIIRQAGAGKIKTKSGAKVQTVVIDSITVLWNVQQEVAAKLAEARAKRKGQNADEATTTQLDWTRAKRPMREIMNTFSNSGIPYLIIVAREGDKYDENGGENAKKIGLKPDAPKGLEYDVNLSVRFYKDEGGWKYKVDKVQGAIAEIFPDGATGSAWPTEKVLEFGTTLKPQEGQEKSEEQVASELASSEFQKGSPQPEKTQASLLKIAKEKYGLDAKEVGSVLSEAGIKQFDPANWTQMIAVLEKAKK